MPKTIIVPVALAQIDKAQSMLDVARQLGGEDGNIVLVTVIEDVPGYIAAELPSGLLENAAEEARGELRTLARSAGMELAVEVRKGSPPRPFSTSQASARPMLIVIAVAPSRIPGFLPGFDRRAGGASRAMFGPRHPLIVVTPRDRVGRSVAGT